MGAVLADILLALLVFLWIFEQMFEKYRPQLTGASGCRRRNTPQNSLTFNYFYTTLAK
jgi:hypothetical protein